MSATSHRPPLAAFAFAAVALLAAVAWWRLDTAAELVFTERRPVGVMGTTCTLGAVTPARDAARAAEALAAAEGVLRRIEAAMSTWIDASEISRLNAAAAGVAVPLSRDTRAVLAHARRFHELTGGAFDVTCRPLLELWRRAAEQGIPPTPEAIATARAASSWELFALGEEGATKGAASARVDLGGIAKGYAADEALRVLRARGLAGGLVEIGGDLAVFGDGPDGGPWSIAVRDPRRAGVWGTIALREGAVCTSGNYARFVEIAGERHSHIVDPRDGRPADRAASITVVAPDATSADAWATALAVLGPEGLARLPADGSVQALLVGLGDDGLLRAAATPALPNLLRPGDPGLTRLLAGEAIPAGG
ncbi:MAG: FAD:protein FMN transferase [Thermoanaerobaculia bacterium]|nr:FAD:protein FMN transferase [Thermoanaerobaculia bacterium]MCZ7651645.1 FAD:protein FMN transferase [Thermoanaerobaculia bacterium]